MQGFAWKGSRRTVLRMFAVQPLAVALADLGLFASTAQAAEERMRVMQFDRYGAPDVFYSAEVERPQPGAGEVLIEIRAIGTNPADTYGRNGKYASRGPGKFPRVVGLDAAGIVAAAGEGVADFRRGDRVVASTKTGSYATYALALAKDCAKLPEGVDYATAAALPCAALTGVQLIEEALPRLQSGQTVLVTGATGSVGRFAVYAARAKGVRVVAAVRPAYLDEARALGAQMAISTDADPPADLRVDYVVDTIGGKVAARLCQALAPGGSIITSVTSPSGDAGIDPAGLPAKPERWQYHHDGKRLGQLVNDVKMGRVSMPIVQRLPLADAAEAHRLMEKGGAGGKIILIP
jgi:NADPH:quinone reductase